MYSTEFEHIWNYIVAQRIKNYDAPENLVQQEWEQYFGSLFNYKPWLGEIEPHRSIQIGSGQRAIPDIIIKNGDKDLFDVELKQYNLPFSIDMEKQLKSYMDLLHISVGILVCQNLYVYVYDFSQSKFKKAEISFTEGNPDGVKFVELFQKDHFLAKNVEAFIDSKENFNENVDKIKAEITEEAIWQLLKQHLSATYTVDEIETACKDILVEVRENSQTITYPVSTSVHMVKQPSKNGMDYSRYLFEGQSLGKSRLVLAVVQAYVRDNPLVTISNLKAVFYDRIQGSSGVIATPNEARMRRNDPEKRYFTNNPILLKDGTVWVCTQWGIGNIDNFIKRANSLGYEIRKVQ